MRFRLLARPHLEVIIPVALTRFDETPVPLQPRAVGIASVSCKLREECTVLDRLHQQGSMKVLFPRTKGPTLTGVLLNTAGGVTGGDRFDISASVAPGCHMVLTTQAAERAYRAQTGEIARLTNRVSIGDAARMDWLPQETLLYDCSALRRSLNIDMAVNARLLAVEPVIFGRTEMSEVPDQIEFRDEVTVRRGDQLVFADRTRVNENATAQLRGNAIGKGCAAMASILLIAPDAERLVDPARALMPSTGGVSLIRDGVLFARILAADGFILRQALVPLIELLGAATIPRTWMI